MNLLVAMGYSKFESNISPIDAQCAMRMTFVWLEVLIHWKAVWSCASKDNGELSVMTRLVRLMLVLFADSLVSLQKVSRLRFTDTQDPET